MTKLLSCLCLMVLVAVCRSQEPVEFGGDLDAIMAQFYPTEVQVLDTTAPPALPEEEAASSLPVEAEPSRRKREVPTYIYDRQRA